MAASQPEAETVKAADQAAPAAENWSEELLDARLEEALRQAMGNAAPTPGQPERGQKPAPEKERVRKAQSRPTQAQPRRTEAAEAKPAQQNMEDTFGLEKALEALMSGIAPSPAEETDTIQRRTDTPVAEKPVTEKKAALTPEKTESVTAAQSPQAAEIPSAVNQPEKESPAPASQTSPAPASPAPQPSKAEKPAQRPPETEHHPDEHEGRQAKPEEEEKYGLFRHGAKPPEQGPSKMEAAAPIAPEAKPPVEEPKESKPVQNDPPEDALLQSVNKLLGDMPEPAQEYPTVSADELLKELERLLNPAQTAAPAESEPLRDAKPITAPPTAPPQAAKKAQKKEAEADRKPAPVSLRPEAKQTPVQKKKPEREKEPEPVKASQVEKAPETEKNPAPANRDTLENTGELLKSLESLLGAPAKADAPKPEAKQTPEQKKKPEREKEPEPVKASPAEKTPEEEKNPAAANRDALENTGELLKSLESLLGAPAKADAPKPEAKQTPVQKKNPERKKEPEPVKASPAEKTPETEKKPTPASSESLDNTGELLKSLESLLGAPAKADAARPEAKQAPKQDVEPEPDGEVDAFLQRVDALLGRVSAQSTPLEPTKPRRQEVAASQTEQTSPSEPMPQTNEPAIGGEVAGGLSEEPQAPTQPGAQNGGFWAFLDDLKQELRPDGDGACPVQNREPAPQKTDRQPPVPHSAEPLQTRPTQNGGGATASEDRQAYPTPHTATPPRTQDRTAQEPKPPERREAPHHPAQAEPQSSRRQQIRRQPGALSVEELLAAAVPAELAAGAHAAVSAQRMPPKTETGSHSQRRHSAAAGTQNKSAPASEEPDRGERNSRPEAAAAGRTPPRGSQPRRVQGTRQSPAPEELSNFSGIRSSFDKVPPLQEHAVLHPEEAYKKYGKQLGATGSRLIFLCFLTLVGVFLTLYAALGWHFLPEALTARVLAYTLLVLMLLSAALCLDLFADALRALGRMRLELNGLLLLAAAAVAVDTFFAAAGGRVPFCAAVQFLLIFALWGKYARCMSMMTATRTLRGMVDPVGIVEVQDVTRGRRGLSRAQGSVEQFMSKFTTDNPGDAVMRVYAPLAAVVSFAGALILSLTGHGSFPWMLSLMLIGSVPLVGLLGYPRLFHCLCKRLSASGAAVCGWYGAEVFGGEHSILLEDDDLFPPGSVKLNGMKVYHGDIDRTISYVAAATELCGSAMHRLFNDLLENRNGRHYRMSRHRFYEGGGLGAEISGDILLLGSYAFMKRMGVHMEGCAKLRQAVYASVNGELAAVFAVKYQPSDAVRKGLAAISHNHHFKPILATRDFLVTPEFLKEKYQISVSNFTYPSTKERIRLSEAEFKKGAEQGALLSGNSFGAFAEAAAGGRVLKSATLCSVALSVISGVLSLALMLALASFGSAEAANAVNVLLYLAGWSIPALLLTGWTRHY